MQKAGADLVQFIAHNTMARIGATGLLTTQDIDEALKLGRGQQRQHPTMCNQIPVADR